MNTIYIHLSQILEEKKRKERKRKNGVDGTNKMKKKTERKLIPLSMMQSNEPFAKVMQVASMVKNCNEEYFEFS